MLTWPKHLFCSLVRAKVYLQYERLIGNWNSLMRFIFWRRRQTSAAQHKQKSSRLFSTTHTHCIRENQGKLIAHSEIYWTFVYKVNSCLSEFLFIMCIERWCLANSIVPKSDKMCSHSENSIWWNRKSQIHTTIFNLCRFSLLFLLSYSLSLVWKKNSWKITPRMLQVLHWTEYLNEISFSTRVSRSTRDYIQYDGCNWIIFLPFVCSHSHDSYFLRLVNWIQKSANDIKYIFYFTFTASATPTAWN